MVYRYDDNGTGENEQVWSKTTFGSEGNAPLRYKWPMSLVYQPLDEIRDYYGNLLSHILDAPGVSMWHPSGIY
eukprot:COSAG05_NODE_12526_length_464_cov_1.126027_1_plen_73_part_00